MPNPEPNPEGMRLLGTPIRTRIPHSPWLAGSAVPARFRCAAGEAFEIRINLMAHGRLMN